MTAILRVGIIGGGLITQAVHLPNLADLADRFTAVAVADPSRRVREAIAARYSPLRPYADWRELLAREDLDAVMICSPHATHAPVVLDALDRGIHVFVEKPLCITLDDADAICERAIARDRVVQVGYMKRFSKAYASFLACLPDSPEGLRLVDVVTYDPWMAREPFVPSSRMVSADDIPLPTSQAIAEATRTQVAHAVGADDEVSVHAYSYTYLACLVHDVNLVHGVLDKLGLAGTAEPIHSTSWAEGAAVAGTVRLPGGALWRTNWMLLQGLMTFEERISVYFEDAIHELVFPVPYHTDAPINHRVIRGPSGSHDELLRSFVENPYLSELEHFHACVTAGVVCKTPAAQARSDLATLQELFRRRC